MEEERLRIPFLCKWISRKPLRTPSGGQVVIKFSPRSRCSSGSSSAACDWLSPRASAVSRLPVQMSTPSWRQPHSSAGKAVRRLAEQSSSMRQARRPSVGGSATRLFAWTCSSSSAPHSPSDSGRAMRAFPPSRSCRNAENWLMCAGRLTMALCEASMARSPVSATSCGSSAKASSGSSVSPHPEMTSCVPPFCSAAARLPSRAPAAAGSWAGRLEASGGGPSGSLARRWASSFDTGPATVACGMPRSMLPCSPSVTSGIVPSGASWPTSHSELLLRSRRVSEGAEASRSPSRPAIRLDETSAVASRACRSSGGSAHRALCAAYSSWSASHPSSASAASRFFEACSVRSARAPRTRSSASRFSLTSSVTSAAGASSSIWFSSLCARSSVRSASIRSTSAGSAASRLCEASSSSSVRIRTMALGKERSSLCATCSRTSGGTPSAPSPSGSARRALCERRRSASRSRLCHTCASGSCSIWLCERLSSTSSSSAPSSGGTVPSEFSLASSRSRVSLLSHHLASEGRAT
eukprot:scaffold302537_cov26-Tisochrysis_lutea.AAC.2